MYPTIFDLVKDVFGLEIGFLKIVQSFGFFVALAFVAANYFMTIELKRKEKEGLVTPLKKKMQLGKPVSSLDYFSSALLGFVIGYKVLGGFLNYDSLVDNPQDFLLSLQGEFMGGLLLAGLFVYFKYREDQKIKLQPQKEIEVTVKPHELMGNMTLLAAVAGLLGAKLFHNLENLGDFIRDPWEAIFSFSGLTFYGGLICGTAAVLIYARKNGISMPVLLDVGAPAMMLAYGVGRMGCQISGDGDWGVVNALQKPDWLSFLPDWAWAYRYPNNVISAGEMIEGCVGRHCTILPEAVWPTPLYESLAGIFLFFLLWGLRKKFSVPGLLFSLYLMLNGLERFLIEKIRVNTEYHVGESQFTQAEMISVFLFIAGASWFIYLKMNKRRDIGNLKEI